MIENDIIISTPKTPPANRGSHGWILAAILGLALGLRLAYVLGLAEGVAFSSVDAQGYHILATNLLERHAFTLNTAPPYLPDGIRTPLYPAFLALILAAGRGADSAVPLAQALIDTVTVALVYALAARLAGPRRGNLAALLYALNPISFLFIGEALTEILLAFLLTLTFIRFVSALDAGPGRRTPWLVTGLLSAACILVKPNVVLLPLILGFALLVDRRRLSRRILGEVALLAGAVLLGLAPWLARNWLAFGRPFLSLAFDDNLAHVSAVAALAESEDEVVAPWTPRWEEIYLAHIAAPTAYGSGWTGEPQTAAEALARQRQLAATARRVVGEHPVAFSVSHVKGVARSFVPSVQRHWYAYATHQPWPESDALRIALAWTLGRILARDWIGGLGGLGQWWLRHPLLARWLWAGSLAAYGLGYGLTLLGLWALRRRPGLLISLGLTLLYLVLLPGPIAYIRFWVPALPLAVAVMACALARLSRGNQTLLRNS